VDGKTKGLWRSCNGSGRCTTSGKGTNYINWQAIGSRPSRFSPPVNFREVVIPKPGHVFLNLDLPTAHMRIALALSRSVNGKKFLTDGVDCHSVVAASLWTTQFSEPITWQELKALTKEKTTEGKKAKQFRDLAKEVMFGRLNGSGADNLQSRISARLFEIVDIGVITTLCKLIDITYPELKQYRADVWKFTLANVSTMLQDDKLLHIYDVSNHNSFNALPPEYKPFLRFVGQYHPSKWVDGVREVDLEAPKQPKFTQVIASIWARVEGLLMKMFCNYCKKHYPHWQIIIHHYDSNLFQVPASEFESAKQILSGKLDKYFAPALCGWIPTGIMDKGYLDELVPAKNWYEA
jgi:hypothetical protein